MTDEIVERLQQITKSDLCTGGLPAHTLDTTEKAVAEITRLRAEVERLTKERDEALRLLDGYGEFRGALLEKEELARQADFLRTLLTAARAEGERLRARVSRLEAALIDARDTFAGDEDDDRYWAWFNRHEDTAFAGLSERRTEER